MPNAALSATELDFIQKRQRGVVKVLRPRLAVRDQNLATGVPVCTTAPAVTGTPAVGQVLTSDNGTWSGTSPSYAKQWFREGKGAISGATAATYTLVAADSGSIVFCQVTASNTAGSAATISNRNSVA